MGGQPWGGSTVPASLSNAYNAYGGLKSDGTWPKGTDTPVYATYNMKEAIEALWQDADYSSPYALAELHDPNPDLDAVLERFDEYDMTVADLDPVQDWQSMAATVATTLAQEAGWVDQIDALVDAYERDQTPELQRSLARMSAQLSSLNAFSGTAAAWSHAILESAHRNKIAEYRAQLEIEARKSQAALMVQSIAHVIQMIQLRVESHRMATALRAELARTNIAANTDWTANQLKIDVEAEKWNIGLLHNVKAVDLITGAPSLQRGLEPWQAFTSMAFSAVGGLFNMLPMLMHK